MGPPTRQVRRAEDATSRIGLAGRAADGRSLAPPGERTRRSGGRHDRRFPPASAGLRRPGIRGASGAHAALFRSLPRPGADRADVAQAGGKDVRLDIEGGDVEIDRSILEGLKDPLVHLVRNAVDHGIESPDARLRSGKSPYGRLLVKAALRGPQVEVVVADDGHGVDLEAVRLRALDRGLVATGEERELLQVLFHPGFSTADHYRRFRTRRGARRRQGQGRVAAWYRGGRVGPRSRHTVHDLRAADLDDLAHAARIGGWASFCIGQHDDRKAAPRWVGRLPFRRRPRSDRRRRAAGPHCLAGGGPGISGRRNSAPGKAAGCAGGGCRPASRLRGR